MNKVFVGMSSESFPATDQRTAYVALTRGKEQVQVFTDDKAELLRAICRQDDPLSATNLAEHTKTSPPKMPAMFRQPSGLERPLHPVQIDHGPSLSRPELTHDR